MRVNQNEKCSTRECFSIPTKPSAYCHMYTRETKREERGLHSRYIVGLDEIYILIYLYW